MISNIKTAADNVGITAVVTNSKERIETQLNSLTREEDSPLMLVSWDIKAAIGFDSNGILKTPIVSITALLVSKPEELTKESSEEKSEEMAQLFLLFFQNLYSILSPQIRGDEQPITEASFQYVPVHGAGKHSGILATWKQIKPISIVCQND